MFPLFACLFIVILGVTPVVHALSLSYIPSLGVLETLTEGSKWTSSKRGLVYTLSNPTPVLPPVEQSSHTYTETDGLSGLVGHMDPLLGGMHLVCSCLCSTGRSSRLSLLGPLCIWFQQASL